MFAFWINFLNNRGLVNSDKYLGKNIVNRLDFTAHVCGIIGLVGLLGSAYLGLIDASGVDFTLSLQSYQEALDSIMVILDFNLVIEGFNNAVENQILGYKVVWSMVGVQLFLLSGIIRFYFVALRKKNIYDTNIAVQVIYSGAASWGFVVMIAISAAGGIYSYNESVMENVPILSNLLPGSSFSLLPVLSIFFGFLALMVISSALVWKKEEKNESI
jgi:hypothetical protein